MGFSVSTCSPREAAPMVIRAWSPVGDATHTASMSDWISSHQSVNTSVTPYMAANSVAFSRLREQTDTRRAPPGRPASAPANRWPPPPVPMRPNRRLVPGAGR